MATFNGERYIKEQIDSILSQTYQNFELIIGDDCSTDSTLSILKEYAQKDERIVIIQNPENLGFKKNFENLLHYAKGDFIALSDQDDIWTLNHLELLLSKATEYDLVCSNSSLIDINGQPLNFTMKDVFNNKYLKYDKESIQIHLLHYNFVQGSTCLISRSLIEKSLPIPENIKYHDYWFALNAAFSKEIFYFDESLLLYRQHNTNVTSNNKWNLFERIFDTPHKNRITWANQIDLLQTFLYRTDLSNDESYRIQESINYFNNLLDNKVYKCFNYFINNYEAIYFDKNIILKFFRFIKLFILKV